MKDLLKGKLITTLIVIATLILAGVAIFTALRLYQLRGKSISLKEPESQPLACHCNDASVTQNTDGTYRVVAHGSGPYGWRIVQLPGESVIAGPQSGPIFASVTLTAGNQYQAQAATNQDRTSWTTSGCVFQISETPTSTPSPTPTPTQVPPTSTPTGTSTPTATQTPSPTPVPSTQACHPLIFTLSQVTPTVRPTTPPGATSTPTLSPTKPPSIPEPPVCAAAKPSAPTITSVKRDGTKATLTWTKVDLATHYTISYGTSPDNLEYGVPNTGKVTTYTIGSLDSSKKYYFVVRAVNDCMPSDTSPIVSSVAGTGTAAEESLPSAGIGIPTIFASALGVLVIFGALLLAL